MSEQHTHEWGASKLGQQTEELVVAAIERAHDGWGEHHGTRQLRTCGCGADYVQVELWRKDGEGMPQQVTAIRLPGEPTWFIWKPDGTMGTALYLTPFPGESVGKGAPTFEAEEVVEVRQAPEPIWRGRVIRTLRGEKEWAYDVDPEDGSLPVRVKEGDLRHVHIWVPGAEAPVEELDRVQAKLMEAVDEGSHSYLYHCSCGALLATVGTAEFGAQAIRQDEDEEWRLLTATTTLVSSEVTISGPLFGERRPHRIQEGSYVRHTTEGVEGVVLHDGWADDGEPLYDITTKEKLHAITLVRESVLEEPTGLTANERRQRAEAVANACDHNHLPGRFEPHVLAAVAKRLVELAKWDPATERVSIRGDICQRCGLETVSVESMKRIGHPTRARRVPWGRWFAEGQDGEANFSLWLDAEEPPEVRWQAQGSIQQVAAIARHMGLSVETGDAEEGSYHYSDGPVAIRDLDLGAEEAQDTVEGVQRQPGQPLRAWKVGLMEERGGKIHGILVEQGRSGIPLFTEVLVPRECQVVIQMDTAEQGEDVPTDPYGIDTETLATVLAILTAASPGEAGERGGYHFEPHRDLLAEALRELLCMTPEALRSHLASVEGPREVAQDQEAALLIRDEGGAKPPPAYRIWAQLTKTQPHVTLWEVALALVVGGNIQPGRVEYLEGQLEKAREARERDAKEVQETNERSERLKKANAEATLVARGLMGIVEPLVAVAQTIKQAGPHGRVDYDLPTDALRALDEWDSLMAAADPTKE